MTIALAREALLRGRDIPVIWEFYPTTACNLRCVYCYLSLDQNPFKDRARPQFNEAQLRAFLERYTRSRDMVSFIGGEPFLGRTWLRNFFALANDMGRQFRYHAFTNGTLLQHTSSDILERFEYLSVSIDGDENTTNQARGRDVYQRVIEGVAATRAQYDLPMLGRITVMPENDVFDSVMAVLPHFDLVYWQFANGVDLSKFDAVCKWREVEQLLTLWLERIEQQGEVLPLYSFLVVAEQLLLQTENQALTYPPLDAIGCGAGANYFQVFTDGKLYVCPELVDQQDACMGTMQEGFMRVLTSQDFAPARKCKHCHVALICRTRCIHANPEPYCVVIRALIDTMQAHLGRIQKAVRDGLVQRDEFRVKQQYVNGPQYKLQHYAELEFMF